MTPTQALAMAEALISAARKAIEDGQVVMPADTFSEPAQKALDELRAEIEKHKAG